MGVSKIYLTLLVVCSVWSVVCGKLSEQDRQMLLSAMTDIQTETIDGHVTIDSGAVPSWLSGNFIRHSCGVFGDTAHISEAPLNYISHLFDCMEIGSKFRLDNGTVTFTNMWYDTVTNDIYNHYGRDMNKSSVYYSGTYSETNKTQVSKYSKQLNQPGKIAEVPHVSWWKVGNEAVAMSESPIGVIVDPGRVVQKGNIHYTDNNFGYGDSVQFTNNPAHEQTEADGTLWSTTTVEQFTSQTSFKQWRLVYKVGADKHRHAVGKYPYGDADLTQCTQTKPYPPYPDMTSRFGYLHSFAMTENYIILPETAYMSDPCFYAHYQPDVGFFPQAFRFEPTGKSRLLVMRKSDGQFLKTVETRPFFVTHQLGSYEDGELIHMDMLMYNDSSIYSNVVSTKTLLSELNVDTGVELKYVFPRGMFPQEPQFISRPNSSSEDDGVILSQGMDSRKNKAFLVVLDARTMALLAHVTAPDYALFGIHNRFFGLDVGKADGPVVGIIG